jgi:hypothetical protein
LPELWPGRYVSPFGPLLLLTTTGHKLAQCENARALDFSGVEEKTAEEAWNAIQAADKEQDLEDLRDVRFFTHAYHMLIMQAIKVYVKAVPPVTYKELERSFRTNNMESHIIAYEQEVTDTFTLMDLQGNLDRKYTVGFFFSDKPQRAKMQQGWPETPEENMTRLENAGVPVDRKVPKCSNCESK